MILGLDISTSCTGWCVLSESGSLIDLGYTKFKSGSSILDKADEMEAVLLELNRKYGVKKIFVEENLQAFRPGFSSAKTIVTLARFNGIVSYVASKVFSTEPNYVNVNVARKSMDIKIISKRKGGKNTKDQVFDWVASRIEYEWPSKELKSGPRRGLTVLDDARFDMADAYVIAVAGRKLNI